MSTPTDHAFWLPPGVGLLLGYVGAGRVGQLAADILGGESHRYHAGLVPRAFLALQYVVGFVQNVTHHYLLSYS